MKRPVRDPGANVHTHVTARRHEIEKKRVRGNGILASHALSSHGRDRGSVRRSFAYERDHRGAAKPDEKQQVQAKLHQRPGWRSSWGQSQSAFVLQRWSELACCSRWWVCEVCHIRRLRGADSKCFCPDYSCFAADCRNAQKFIYPVFVELVRERVAVQS